MRRQTVRALLGRDVPTLEPTATLTAAAAMLTASGRDAIAVVRRGRLLGLVLAEDLAAARPSAASTLSIGEMRGLLDRVVLERIMRRDVPTIAPDTPVTEAARLLRDGAPPLPVVDGARLVGLIGVADMLEALEQGHMGQDVV